MLILSLPNIVAPLVFAIFLTVVSANVISGGELDYSFLFIRYIPVTTFFTGSVIPRRVAKVIVIAQGRTIQFARVNTRSIFASSSV